MFNVKVSSVKTVSVKGKKKRMGMRSGKTNDWKKAYIKLEEGQKMATCNRLNDSRGNKTS